MFTGIVEGMGTVVSSERVPGGLRMALDLGQTREQLGHGSSIAIAGVCLTVVGGDVSIAEFDLSSETLEKTRLGSVSPGDRLNLERPLAAGADLGGHFVTGHVDGLGEVLEVRPDGDYQVQRYRAPASVAPYLVAKGSVAVEGVSLTVAELLEEGVFEVALIPETLERTTLGLVRPGDPLHLEGDLLGKYVLRYMKVAAADPEALREALGALESAPTWQPPG